MENSQEMKRLELERECAYNGKEASGCLPISKDEFRVSPRGGGSQCSGIAFVEKGRSLPLDLQVLRFQQNASAQLSNYS
jgi:hypothetical protein